MSPKILFLSVNCFPPVNPEAFVNAKLVLAMLESGWDVDVITRDNTRTRVYPLPEIGIWKPIARVTHYAKSFFKRPSDIQNPQAISHHFHHLKTVMANLSWVYSAYYMGRHLSRRKDYDFIISRSIPISGHLAALGIVRKIRIPWIANWNDPEPWQKMPWPYGNGPGAKYSLFWKLSLYYILKEVSWCTFPCERLQRYMCSYLPGDLVEKSSIIPHIALNQSKVAGKNDSEVFYLCYAGNLGNDRDPGVFLDGVRRFLSGRRVDSPFQVQFISSKPDRVAEISKRLGIDPFILKICAKSYSETQSLLTHATVLLNIEAPFKEGIFFPSKFVDYVQLGRPILSVSPTDGTIADLLIAYGGGIAVDNTRPDLIARAIEKLYLAWESGTLNKEYSSAHLLNLFKPKRIISEYLDLFRLLRD